MCRAGHFEIALGTEAQRGTDIRFADPLRKGASGAFLVAWGRSPPQRAVAPTLRAGPYESTTAESSAPRGYPQGITRAKKCRPGHTSPEFGHSRIVFSRRR